MRLVLYNPHISSWYKTSVPQYLNKIKASLKYEYLFDYLYNYEKKVYVYIDDISIPVPIPRFLKKLVPSLFGFYLWIFINGLNPFKFIVLQKTSELTKNDALLIFYYSNFASHIRLGDEQINKLIEKMKNIVAYKIINMTHFVWDAGFGSKNLQQSQVQLLISESDLSRNSAFFKKYFSWYKKEVFILPFVPQKRFVNKIKYNERKNIALAVGSLNMPINNTMDQDFIHYFKDNKFHPMRNEIYDNQNKLKKYIDSYIPIYDGNPKNEIIDDINNNRLQNLFHKIRNRINNIKKTLSIYLKILIAIIKKGNNFSYTNDREYMQFDLVSTFNQYKMCIVPEERVGLPGISFVEAMACGCAFIGLRDKMYSDIGLKDKVHYIGYDGTLKDLICCISYYMTHENELEIIAHNGYEFIKKNINTITVMEKFKKYIQKEINIR